LFLPSLDRPWLAIDHPCHNKSGLHPFEDAHTCQVVKLREGTIVPVREAASTEDLLKTLQERQSIRKIDFPA
jgi:hypothetical protein